ncbi:MAG: hypothetical protein M1480_01460 [Bacteroidetes bacterium]|nr:hypothetical protein [Bacteroidota bacterium]
MVLSKNDKVRQGQTGVKKRVKIFAVSCEKYGVDYGKNFLSLFSRFVLYTLARFMKNVQLSLSFFLWRAKYIYYCYDIRSDKQYWILCFDLVDKVKWCLSQQVLTGEK